MLIRLTERCPCGHSYTRIVPTCTSGARIVGRKDIELLSKSSGRAIFRGTRGRHRRPTAASKNRKCTVVRVVSSIDQGSEVSHQVGDVINKMYTIQEILGSGSAGQTYKANTADGLVVAIKVLSLKGLKSWKQLELFEREAKTLQNLSHKAIPKYIDYFELDSSEDKRFYLVQQLAPGIPLSELIEEGTRLKEEVIESIAVQLLDILEYLGSLRPPVIHRDIKPENIIIDKKDNKVFLVDFGGVQAVAAQVSSVGGSTIIGTYGYMAPEQFSGSAVEASDLYGLGATLLYMLSGAHPSEFPKVRLKLKFQDKVTMSRKIDAVLDGLLEPAPEDRPSISEVRRILAGKDGEMIPRSGTSYSSGRVRFKRTYKKLSLTLMPEGISSSGLMVSSFALAWNTFIFIWTRSALLGAGPLFAAFSLPFWFAGASLGKQALQSFYNSACKQHFEVNDREYLFWKELPTVNRPKAKRSRKEKSGRRSNLKLVGIEQLYSTNDVQVAAISFMTDQGKLYIGEGLTLSDLQVLFMEIEDFLKQDKAVV